MSHKAQHLVDVRDHLGRRSSWSRSTTSSSRRRCPVIREDLDASLEQPRVDGQRVHADVRRAAADRRGARRPLRAPADVRRSGSASSRSPRPLRRSRRRDGARRRARGAGRRRRDRHAADADDPLGGGAGREARARARRVGRHRRARRRARAARRRRGRQRDLLALDLLAERSDRARARPARVVAAGREPRPGGQARPAAASVSSAPACSGSCGASFAATRRLGSPEIVGSLVVGARPRRAVRPVGAAHAGADAADALLPQPRVRADERRVAVHVLRDVRLDLPARAVLPDGAGLLAASARACASCRGRRCRSSSRRSRARSRIGSAGSG